MRWWGQVHKRHFEKQEGEGLKWGLVRGKSLDEKRREAGRTRLLASCLDTLRCHRLTSHQHTARQPALPVLFCQLEYLSLLFLHLSVSAHAPWPNVASTFKQVTAKRQHPFYLLRNLQYRPITARRPFKGRLDVIKFVNLDLACIKLFCIFQLVLTCFRTRSSLKEQ